ncbi:penicillin-binding transpeptidase domain-containing protein [Haliangium sp.]|uniref:penicillin-binding transpeptidase domain-containing protein n=1 Tax=Haliangium sp. TaxID=2663208 RepID=UPI003D1074AA
MSSPSGKRRRAAPVTISPRVSTRIYIVGVILTAMFLGIAYRAYGLQIDQADKYRTKARRQHLRTVELPAPRGPILDIQGRELAVTADADSVYANPRQVSDANATARSVAAVLGLDVRALEASLVTRRHFVWIERHVTPEEARQLRDLELEGIYLTPEPRRFYPGKGLAGPVLGFAGIDGDGLDGLELRMDELLRGEQARVAALRDAAGRVMMADGVVKARPGATVTLTLDRAIQDVAERALADAVAEHQAKGGSLVVVDVATGGVLAMASQPTYDPNSPGRAVRTHARNRAVTDAYEIGSVMKVFTVTAALDAGVVSPEELIDVEGGSLQVGRKLIRDTYHDDVLSVAGVIKRSSNVGAVKVAARLGADELYQALARYGFGTKTGIELPGERAGKLRSPKRWGEIGLASMAFGYGMTVTALQVAAGFAAVGAGGVYREPRIIHEVRDASGRVLYQHQPIDRQVMRPETAAAMLPMLASVFDKGRDGGTARSLDPPPFPVGAKTGTARKVDPETRQYSRELYVSSFAGLAPIDDPRIAVVVLLDEPRGEHYYGAHVAGPAFVQVVDETLRYLGVPPQAGDEPRTRAQGRRTRGEPSRPPAAISNAPEPTPTPAGIDGDAVAIPFAEATLDDLVTVPDFRGLGMGHALSLAREVGVELELEGTGRAVAQYPPPGPSPRPVTCRVLFAPAHRADPLAEHEDLIAPDSTPDGDGLDDLDALVLDPH